MRKLWYLPFLLISVMCTSEKEAQFTKPEEKEQGVYFFKIHNVYFEVDGNTGARISSFKIGSEEILSGKEIHKDNWGSTFWTSPQKDWGNIPPSNIDRNQYQGRIEGDAIVLKSEKDDKLGYTIEKKFSANTNDTSVTITYKIINNSTEKRKVAPWEVTRVSPDGLTLFPSDNKHSPSPFMYDQDGITYFEYESKKAPRASSNKLTSESSEGWMAYIKDGVAFIKKFGDVSTENIAPQEGEIELYTNPDKTYLEIDEQGEYAELNPGQSLEWEVKWSLKKLPSNIKVEKGNKDLVNYVRSVVQ